VSGLIAPPRAPDTRALTAPTLYVHDPPAVAIPQGWEGSPPGLGRHLIRGQGPELEGPGPDHRRRYAPPAQARMDGCCGPRPHVEAAENALFRIPLPPF